MSENIIWALNAKIKDGEREAFDAVMSDLIEASSKEEGTLHYEWSIAEDQQNFHVYERFKDADAAIAHLGTFGANAERFMAAVDVTGFVVYSKPTPELEAGLAVLNPVYMAPFGGFVK